jgi:hypothetical protein
MDKDLDDINKKGIEKLSNFIKSEMERAVKTEDQFQNTMISDYVDIYNKLVAIFLRDIKFPKPEKMFDDLMDPSKYCYVSRSKTAFIHTTISAYFEPGIMIKHMEPKIVRTSFVTPAFIEKIKEISLMEFLSKLFKREFDCISYETIANFALFNAFKYWLFPDILSNSFANDLIYGIGSIQITPGKNDSLEDKVNLTITATPVSNYFCFDMSDAPCYANMRSNNPALN